MDSAKRRILQDEDRLQTRGNSSWFNVSGQHELILVLITLFVHRSSIRNI
jgi:hypothetical protein